MDITVRVCKDNVILQELKLPSETFVSDDKLLCGEIRYGQDLFPSYMNFTTIMHLGTRLVFFPSRQIIEFGALEEGEHITINVIEPVPIPLPESVNESLSDAKNLCYSHLFFRETGSTNLVYLSSVVSSWGKYFGVILDSLSDKGMPLFNISVEMLNESGSSSPAIASSFFEKRNSYKNGRKIMVMIISSDINRNVVYPTSKIPSIPRHIAQLAALKSRDGGTLLTPEISRSLRRLMTVAINGGVAVDLLESCQLQVSGIPIKATHFSKKILHLNNVDIEENSLLDKLDLPLGNLLYYLKTYSNEASFCGLFWNVTLSTLFRFDETRLMPPNHRLEQEWNTLLLYRDQANASRRVDLVCLIEFEALYGSTPTDGKRTKLVGEKSIPILTVEAGRYGFSRENMHKDFGKTLGLISADCVTLAHHLIALGRKPEEATTYGILIGGSNIQLCTAHAVVTKINGKENLYEIHANLTFDDHWFMSCVLVPPPSSGSAPAQQSCRLPCCACDARLAGLESIKPADESIDLSPVNLSEIGSVDVPEEEEAPPLLEFPTIGSNIGSPDPLFFKKLKAFVDCVKSRIDLLKSSDIRIVDTSKRNFHDREGQFYFSQANPGVITQTLNKGVPQELQKRDNNSKVLTFKVKKSSQSEQAIYCECSAYFPSNFPRLFGIEESDDNAFVTYEFERMVHFKSFIFNELNNRISLFPFLKFGIDCLFGLHILHEKIGIIHCDISPANIMYSEGDNAFKLFDFDLSVRKEGAGEVTCRPGGVGTRGFIAPESEASGIYNEASDVYSLGSVIFTELVPTLLQIDVDEDSSSNQFIRTIAGMIEPVPERRLSVIGSMGELIALLYQISPSDGQIDLGPTVASARILLYSMGREAAKKASPLEISPQTSQLKTLAPLKELKEEGEGEGTRPIESHSHEIQI